MSTTPIHLERPDGKGLAAGTLGLWGSTVIGLASTAPVYSLVASLGWVVIAVGAQAPIAFVLAFVPMLLIAFAYRELNNAVPDCGTTFTWGTKAFGPWVGWMGGWGVAVAGMVVLANLAQIASVYFWSLIGQDLENNDWRVIIVAVIFIAAMTWVSWRGVEIGERIQNILLGIQYLALVVFIVAVFWQIVSGNAPNSIEFSWEWMNPFAFTSWSGFTEAILLALFIYWGWDTCLALNEETKDPKRIPGRAALLTCVILLFTYVAVTIAAMMYAGLGETGTGLGNEEHADDFFLAIKDGLLGPFGWVLVVAVIISAVSSTQTTILPTARGTLAMGVYRALPARFKDVHPVYKTPSFSTIVMGVVAIAYYVGMTLISDNILQDSILSLGLAIAFYYSITGFACVWYFRADLRKSPRDLFFKGIFPLLGGLMLAAAFVQSAIDMWDVDYGYSVIFGIGGTFVVGIGSLAVGLVLMFVWYLFPRSKRYFGGESLNMDTEVMVPEDVSEFPRSIDGGI
ncbi:Putrescine importer PuuP [Microbacterium hydrocarbonoxydans]|jgi:amino acid transporter|uniref:Putrescine importer PuuP n=1 Tax=Microbacterium hydrocarbonoxydans TaxID=273678 RepID=A0A0M2HSS6_9MICO|nr:APC family permease [Microbacterium hydrocarbonoxydans]KJL47538.1 Putrescine importer PuuP [Microbacterium hydrocarbonoxydans]